MTAVKLIKRVILLFLWGLMAPTWAMGHAPQDVKTLWLNGRIEADHILAATRLSGRVQKLLVKEGDHVEAGQVLAQLDDTQVRAKVTQAASAWHAAKAQYQAVQEDYAAQAKRLPLQIARAEAALNHARAAEQAAKARQQKAQADYRRLQVLFRKGQISKDKLEKAQLALSVAQSELKTAHAAVVQAEKALNEAKLGYVALKAKQAQVEAAHAQMLQAHAALEEAMSALDDMRIRAPAAGVVVARLVQLGEVLAPGAVLYDLVNLDQLYFQGYLPENRLGAVRLGQVGLIHVDGLTQPVKAEVRFISSQAEFTPKEVQVKEERIKQVFKTKLYLLDNPEHRLLPGMPADAEIPLTP